jgi:hypothetical protein
MNSTVRRTFFLSLPRPHSEGSMSRASKKLSLVIAPEVGQTVVQIG